MTMAKRVWQLNFFSSNRSKNHFDRLSNCRKQRWLSSRAESSSSRASNRTFLLEARDSRVRSSRTSIKYRSNSGKNRVEQGIWSVRLDFSNKNLLLDSIRGDSSRVHIRAYLTEA